LNKEIFEQLLPKNDHLGMTFRRMFENTSTLRLFRHQRIDWVHIPRKDKKGGSNGETGFPSNSEPIYTFGDLIRSKEMFANYRIKDGIFYFNEKTVLFSVTL
jgi:hypothetical protein